MALRDLPVRLLDLLHHIDDLTQDSVESGDRIMRCWRVGGRTSPFHEDARDNAARSLPSLVPRHRRKHPALSTTRIGTTTRRSQPRPGRIRRTFVSSRSSVSICLFRPTTYGGIDGQRERRVLRRLASHRSKPDRRPPRRRHGYDGGNVTKEDVLSHVGSGVYASTNHRAPRRGAAVGAGGCSVTVSES